MTNIDVAELDVPDRVIDGSESRLYRFRKIVSTQNVRFSSIGTNPVPVYGEAGVIGFASLWIAGTMLIADFAIDYATPERLSAETRTGLRYYPLLTWSVKDGVMAIDGVSLSVSRPADKAVSPIGELDLV